MRRKHTRAALDLYDELGELDERGEVRARSGSLVLVHAVVRPLPGPHREQWERLSGEHPLFLDAIDQPRAACGLRMKVVLPFEFDESEADACGRCRTEVSRWALNPTAWWQEQRRWEQRKRGRDDDAENLAVWRALEQRRRSRSERGAPSAGVDDAPGNL